MGLRVCVLNTQSIAKELAPTAELSQRMQGIALLAGQQDRLAHWHTLQELAGIR